MNQRMWSGVHLRSVRIPSSILVKIPLPSSNSHQLCLLLFSIIPQMKFKSHSKFRYNLDIAIFLPSGHYQ